MVTHEHYFQEKVERNKQSSSTCELRLGSDENNIIYCADFYTNYSRYDVGNKLNNLITVDEVCLHGVMGCAVLVFFAYNIFSLQLKTNPRIH